MKGIRGSKRVNSRMVTEHDDGIQMFMFSPNIIKLHEVTLERLETWYMYSESLGLVDFVYLPEF
jgi:hypothetical protein